MHAASAKFRQHFPAFPAISKFCQSNNTSVLLHQPENSTESLIEARSYLNLCKAHKHTHIQQPLLTWFLEQTKWKTHTHTLTSGTCEHRDWLTGWHVWSCDLKYRFSDGKCMSHQHCLMLMLPAALLYLVVDGGAVGHVGGFSRCSFLFGEVVWGEVNHDWTEGKFGFKIRLEFSI